MHNQHHHNSWLAASIIVNTVLALTVVVKLRTSPAQVYALVQKEQARTNMILEQTTERQGVILELLSGRGVWMRELTDSLRSLGDSRWRVGDERKAWEQFRESNPELRIPESFWPDVHVPAETIIPDPPR